MLRCRTFSVLLALSFFFFFSRAESKVWHVDCFTGSDNGPGSETEPFRTISRAAAVLQPGDTAVIHEGLYHEQIVAGNSGREGAAITYEGTDRHKVVMQGSVRVKDWEKRGNVWRKQGLQPITSENAFVMVDEKRMLERVDSFVALERGFFHLDQEGTYTIRLWDDSNPNTDHDVDVYEYDCAFNSGNRWNGTAKSG